MSVATTLSIRPNSVNTRQYLLFRHDRSLFAIQLTVVREVLPANEQSISPVPNTPAALLGLINLRGEILAVADFGQSIGGNPVDVKDSQSRIVIQQTTNPQEVNSPPIRLGLAVSQVEGVLFFNPDQIVSAAEVSYEIAPFLEGLYDWDGRLVMVVNTAAIAHGDRW
jgi:purine-binding chemotaxis protein CheW